MSQDALFMVIAMLCELRKAQILAAKDEPNTVYHSRIDGCLLPMDGMAP